MNHLLHVIAEFFGFANGQEAGSNYAFWSGAGSDIGELSIIVAALGVARAHNCHVKGCWRVSKHLVNGTPYKVCRKHHPDVPDRVTAEHIAERAR